MWFWECELPVVCNQRRDFPSVVFAFSGGLLLSVQDSASAEEVEQVTQPDPGPGSDTTSNLLSSGECSEVYVFIALWLHYLFKICTTITTVAIFFILCTS